MGCASSILPAPFHWRVYLDGKQTLSLPQGDCSLLEFRSRLRQHAIASGAFPTSFQFLNAQKPDEIGKPSPVDYGREKSLCLSHVDSVFGIFVSSKPLFEEDVRTASPSPTMLDKPLPTSSTVNSSARTSVGDDGSTMAVIAIVKEMNDRSAPKLTMDEIAVKVNAGLHQVCEFGETVHFVGIAFKIVSHVLESSNRAAENRDMCQTLEQKVKKVMEEVQKVYDKFFNSQADPLALGSSNTLIRALKKATVVSFECLRFIAVFQKNSTMRKWWPVGKDSDTYLNLKAQIKEALIRLLLALAVTASPKQVNPDLWMSYLTHEESIVFWKMSAFSATADVNVLLDALQDFCCLDRTYFVSVREILRSKINLRNCNVVHVKEFDAFVCKVGVKAAVFGALSQPQPVLKQLADSAITTYVELQRLQDWLRPLRMSEDLQQLSLHYLKGTREWIIQQVDDWLGNHDGARVMRWRGEHGIGKSSVVAQLVVSQHEYSIGGYVFCRDNDHFRCDATRILKTIVYQIACSCPIYRQKVFKRLASLNLTQVGLKEFARQMFLDLLSSCNRLSPLLIIIDGFDELNAHAKKQFLDVFNRDLIDSLPSWFRVLFTYSPNKDTDKSLGPLQPVDIAMNDKNHHTDLAAASRVMLQGRLSAGENVEMAVRTLTDKSEGKFLWLHFMRLLIAQSPATEWTVRTLRRLPKGLHKMFAKQTLKCSNVDLKPFLIQLIGILLTVKEPITVTLLATLADQELELVELAVYHLNQLFPLYMHDSRIQIPHKALRAWLAHKLPSLDVTNRTDIPSIEKAVFKRSLELICNGNLHLGMSKSKTIAGSLSYALRWFIHHLIQLVPSHRGTAVPSIQKLWDETTREHILPCIELTASVQEVEFLFESIELLGKTVMRSSNSNRSIVDLDLTVLRDLMKFIASHWEGITRFPGTVLMSALQAPTASVILAEAKASQDKFTAPYLQLQQTPKQWSACIASVACHLTFCVVSPDAKWIATGGFKENAIKLWDPVRARLIHSLHGHALGVLCCCVSRTSDILLSGSVDKTLKVWTLKSANAVCTMVGHSGSVTCCAMSLDGRLAVSGSSDKTVKLWEMSTGKLLNSFQGHTEGILACSISADGKRVFSTSYDSSVRTWEVSTGRELLSFDMCSHIRIPDYCSFSDGSNWIIAGDANVTCIWDVASGELIRMLGQVPNEKVFSIAVSPDSSTVLCGTEHHVQLWDTRSWKLVETIRGHADAVICCTMASTNKFVVSGTRDDVIKIWDPSGQIPLDKEGESEVTCCELTVDCQRTLVAVGETLQVRETVTGQLIHSCSDHTATILCCAVSPDGRWYVTGGEDCTLKVWSAMTNQLLMTLSGHTDHVKCCVVSVDSLTIVSGGNDNTIRIWDADMGTLRQTCPGHAVECCAVAPNGGWIVSGGYDNFLRLWDVPSGDFIGALQGHQDKLTCTIIARDGSKIISGSSDKSIKFWDPVSADLLSTIECTSEPVRCQVSTDDKWLLCAFSDCSVACYVVATNEAIFSLKTYNPFSAACIKNACVVFCGPESVESYEVFGMTFMEAHTPRPVCESPSAASAKARSPNRRMSFSTFRRHSSFALKG